MIFQMVKYMIMIQSILWDAYDKLSDRRLALEGQSHRKFITAIIDAHLVSYIHYRVPIIIIDIQMLTCSSFVSQIDIIMILKLKLIRM